MLIFISYVAIPLSIFLENFIPIPTIGCRFAKFNSRQNITKMSKLADRQIKFPPNFFP